MTIVAGQLLFLAAAFASAAGLAQAQDTAAASADHGQLTAIRAIVSSTDRAVAARTWAERDTAASCNGGAVQFDIAVHFDRAHVVRRIHLKGGTGDSAHEVTYYYDPRGRLRFILAKRGAVNGTQEEERSYFSSRGALILRNVRRLAGPGWAWQPADAITDPASWLANPCQKAAA